MSHQDMGPAHGKHDFLNGIVHQFLDSNFSIILIIVSLLIGLAALFVTPPRKIRRSSFPWPTSW